MLVRSPDAKRRKVVQFSLNDDTKRLHALERYKGDVSKYDEDDKIEFIWPKCSNINFGNHDISRKKAVSHTVVSGKARELIHGILRYDKHHYDPPLFVNEYNSHLIGLMIVWRHMVISVLMTLVDKMEINKFH